MKDSASIPPAGDSPPEATLRKTVFVTGAAHNMMGKAAKKLGMSNTDYTSAAIAYFAENEPDPRKVSKSSLAKIENRVVQETYDVREHNANIGNRIVSIIRTFERNMGTLIQQQQAGTFKYLEGIERNILTYLVNIEENLFGTMLERVLSNGVESHMSRNHPADDFAAAQKSGFHASDSEGTNVGLRPPARRAGSRCWPKVTRGQKSRASESFTETSNCRVA
jgi:hypothetical protein